MQQSARTTASKKAAALRQRRLRERRREELETMRRSDRDLRYRVQSLSVQLEKAGRDLAAAQARIQAVEAAQGTAQALREAVQGAMQKLTPAARCAALAHLKAAGVDLANDAHAATPQATPQAARGGSFLIF